MSFWDVEVERKFQSLGRDSVGWDPSGWSPVATGRVSIPRSGFCGVGRAEQVLRLASRAMFQSLGRDSVGWDLVLRQNHLPPGNRFNPSVGILWGGTLRPCSRMS